MVESNALCIEMEKLNITCMVKEHCKDKSEKKIIFKHEGKLIDVHFTRFTVVGIFTFFRLCSDLKLGRPGDFRPGFCHNLQRNWK